MFEVSKVVLTPSQIMSVAGIVATPMDSSVNYEEFLKILNKAVNIMGDLN